MKTQTIVSLAGLLVVQASAQSVLFTFDTAPYQSPLPINVTVGGITAHLTATGQGFSVQQANALGFTPVGFSGLCIYPSSVFGADLLVSFSTTLTDFSILYAPEEYACDSSATMRVTAYRNGVSVGTATTNAVAGTWPSETLGITVPQGFNSVVIHYDAPPVTGGDYGPVFMADNMRVTPAPMPPVLEHAAMLGSAGFRFSFTNWTGLSFTVLAASDPGLPAGSWTVLGSATELSAGLYQFTDSQATNSPHRFYRVTSP
jgi:hypothetical protein